MPGGGSGGGSSTGTISYPGYMEDAHENWLDGGGAPTTAMANSVVDLMNTAQAGASPFAGFVTVDTAAVYGVGVQVLTPFQALEDLDALNLQAIFDAMVVTIDDNVEIIAVIVAETAVLANRMVTDVLPRFQAGMRDIGAVQVTSFVLGEANIEAEATRSIAKLDADLRLQSRQKGWEIAFQWTQLNIEWNRTIAGLVTEIGTRYVEARFKEDQLETEMDAKDVLFDLETYQYGANVMAAIAGGTVSKSPAGSQTSSTLGNVMSGAAVGAQIGALFAPATGGTSVLIGAGIGAAAGLFL